MTPYYLQFIHYIIFLFQIVSHNGENPIEK